MFYYFVGISDFPEKAQVAPARSLRREHGCALAAICRRRCARARSAMRMRAASSAAQCMRVGGGQSAPTLAAEYHRGRIHRTQSLSLARSKERHFSAGLRSRHRRHSHSHRGWICSTAWLPRRQRTLLPTHGQLRPQLPEALHRRRTRWCEPRQKRMRRWIQGWICRTSPTPRPVLNANRRHEIQARKKITDQLPPGIGSLP